MNRIEGIIKDSNQFHHDKHRHSWHQLIYATHGIVKVECLDKYFISPKNQAIWIPSNTIHKTYSTSTTRFRSLLINPSLSIDIKFNQEPYICYVSDILKHLIIKLCEGSFASQEHFYHTEQLLLDELVFAKSIPINSTMPSDNKFHTLCQYLIQNPDKKITLMQAANMVYMGRSSFIRHFKKQTGLNFGQWYQQVKINQGISMLSNGKPLQEVAFNCGYQSVSSFCAMFKRTLGCTPTDYIHDENL